MEPTLSDGQEITVVESTDFGRFDLVVYSSPDGKFPRLAGRIIALGGETIAIQEGRVFINGNKLTDVVELAHNYAVPAVEIDRDAVYILGDNRNFSVDSHIFGDVKIVNILGTIEIETK